MAVTIPSKNRPEWKQMIVGELNHQYRNYVLQTKIHQMRKDMKAGTLTIEQAVDDLYSLCSKYALAVQTDFKVIFKTW